jgi:hypothetical protein
VPRAGLPDRDRLGERCHEDGIYVSSPVTLATRNRPVSISGIVNRPIRTDVPRGGGLLWNVTLSYSPALTP